MMAFTEAHLSRADLDTMLGWLKTPHARTGGARYVPPAGRKLSLLAYERDGKAMAGAEGLIQLVVGPGRVRGTLFTLGVSVRSIRERRRCGSRAVSS